MEWLTLGLALLGGAVIGIALFLLVVVLWAAFLESNGPAINRDEK